MLTRVLAVVFAATILVSAQSQRPTSNRSNAKGSTNNEAAAHPPIHITVTSPEPSPEAAKRDEDRQERNVTAQEDIRDFTRALTILTFVQAAIAFFALWATWKAANAAKTSAEIADNSLRLLNQPWLDTADWAVSEVRGDGVPDGLGGFSERQLIELVVTFNVVNTSHTPATIYQIEVTDIGSGSPATDWTVTSDVGNLITPGGKHPHHVTIAATDMVQRQIDAYESNRGHVVEIRGVIRFRDLFTKPSIQENLTRGERQRHFGRQCILRRNGSEFSPVAGAEWIEPDPYGGEKHGDDSHAENESQRGELGLS